MPMTFCSLTYLTSRSPKEFAFKWTDQQQMWFEKKVKSTHTHTHILGDQIKQEEKFL